MDRFGTPARLSGHIAALPGDAQLVQAGAIQATERVEQLQLGFVMRRADVTGFQRYLGEVYDRRSPHYLKFLDPVQLEARFGAGQTVRRQLLDYLSMYGLEHVRTELGGQLITVRGARADVERALGIEIKDYRRSDGRLFHANVAEPALPQALATQVQAIVGLANYAEPQPVTVDQALNLCGAVTVVFGVIPVTMLAAYFVGLICTAGQIASNPASPTNYCGFLPPVLAAICSGIGVGANPPFGNPYAGNASGSGPHNPPPASGGTGGLNAGIAAALELPGGTAGARGAGQTVAIASFSAFDPADVADWLVLMGIDPARIDRLTRVPVNGGATSMANATEVLLDIAAVWSIAPDADIRVYEAPFAGPGNSFQALFSAMIDDGVDIISNSFAYCENDTSAADVSSIDAILQTAAAAGIGVFSASGDAGSTCLNGSPGTVHVPVGSPNLTAVGGSRLSYGPGFTYGSEVWWDGSADLPPTGQGGFGTSAFFPRPAYQDGLNPNTMRSVPDVVVNADPATGYILCQATDGGCPTGKLYGGTSVAAPIWAGFAALLNEASGMNLGLLNPLIYTHAGTEAFHDAASMGTDFAHVGLGSPNLDVLFRLLAGIPEGLPDPARSEVNYAGSVLGTVPGFAVPGIPADGVSAAVVVVTLRDVDGHTVSGRDVALAADGGTVQIEPAAPLSTDSNGQAVFLLRNLSAELVTLTATDVATATPLDDQPIIPFGVPPVASAGIQAFPVLVDANGVAETTITVTVEDALGRPAPGKQIRIEQGGGNSVIRGPVPPLTDANGEIAFSATNVLGEIVTYTAHVVSDGDLAVPGSAEVEFQNGLGGCFNQLPPPVGLNGWSVEPFITGFDAGPLFFGNVNFGNCVGGDVPTFRGDRVFIANFRSGDFLSLGQDGGSATGALANHGPSLSLDAVGLDGRLYGRRTATTGNFTTGAIFEFDPGSGAIVRTVASNLKCPHALVTDPLSGDLFFDNNCTGAGSDDPLIYRVRDPGGPVPTVEEYAVLPGTPNGRMVFAPNGELFAVSFANASDPEPMVMRVSATDGPQPPTVDPVDGLHSIFWLALAEADVDGAASKLLVLQNDGVNAIPDIGIADLSTAPPTVSPIIEGAGPGRVGPDGCLYATLQHTVYRFRDPSGRCSFLASSRAPTLRLDLDPGAPAPVQGSSQQLVATLSQLEPLADVPVAFRISGANEQLRLVHTGADGRALLDYQGAFPGTDQIIATALRPGDVDDVASNRLQIDWTAGKHVSVLSLNESPQTGAPGEPTIVLATLVDGSLLPPVAVAGASITFTLDGAQCVAVTDALGRAICGLVPTQAGSTTLNAEFAGNAGLTPATDSAGFIVFVPEPQDLLFKDGFESFVQP